MDVGFFETIARDLSGKGQFRLILQPLAALILGVRFGIADANAGKSSVSEPADHAPAPALDDLQGVAVGRGAFRSWSRW